MASSETLLHVLPVQQTAKANRSLGIWLATALTPAVLLIHGYHPYAEDGGVYLAGIKHLLNPHLYPAFTGFATAHLRYEMFAPLVAALVRVSGIPLMNIVLALYVLSVWATLFAVWKIACRITAGRVGRVAAVVTFALTLTVPVAGTSLLLMDPYLTARSISTPCGLLAIAAVLDAIEEGAHWKYIVLSSGILLVAGICHPLMAAYTLGCILLLLCAALTDHKLRLLATILLCGSCVAFAAVLTRFNPPVPQNFAQIALTRDYWFVGAWHWYEQFGLLAPFAVLGLLAWRARGTYSTQLRLLAWMSIAAAVTALIIAVAFARRTDAVSIVARLQPLRVYQTIYSVMLLCVGAWAGEWVLKRNVICWAIFLAILAPLMYEVQRQTFAASAHVELPWRATSNAWGQGFVWIRDHTAVDTLVALDARYIDAPGEDAQNFRAIAERSAVPDHDKDGGIASIAPDLTNAWLRGETLQAHLDAGVNAGRAAELRAAGASWVVLTAQTPAALPCPYANQVMKVCRVSY